MEMVVFPYTNHLLQKKKINYVRKLYSTSDIIAGKVCARFMPHFIALLKFPKPDTALHQHFHVHPFVLAFSLAVAAHFPGAGSFPHALTGAMPHSPATVPGPWTEH